MTIVEQAEKLCDIFRENVKLVDISIIFATGLRQSACIEANLEVGMKCTLCFVNVHFQLYMDAISVK